MKKIDYAPVVSSPESGPSKAEVRVMFLFNPDGSIEPMIMWARVTRGKLVSVGQNLTEPWTGGAPVYVVDEEKTGPQTFRRPMAAAP